MSLRTHLSRVDPVLVQAVIAGALSFSHLQDLAAASGQTGWKAWAYPVSVDLLLVAAWRQMRERQQAGLPSAGPRLWFLVALAASLGANTATAGLLDLTDVPAWLRIVVAGWPAVAFFGGTLLAHSPRGSAVTADGPDEPLLPPPAVAATGALVLDKPAAPGSSPAVPLPPALVERVRVLADEHRARTGEDPEPDVIRARLGLPSPMTPSVAAHL
ncbi:DUF2637 domain-containing protein [Streptomyces sp. NPDC094448]|uniref:DUF2637 domain-containing protein n=1 Tax=Streptomyces sp. NPDC094448 TaxID=3366063 RepID=UPI0038150F92